MAEAPGAPFAAYIGAMLEEKSPGYSRLFLKTGPQHADATGRVHTGALTSIMDSAIGIALARLRGDISHLQPHATISMSTSFFTSATPGDEIVFEGRVTRVADGAAFGEAEARRRSDDEPIAKAHLTFAIPGGSQGWSAPADSPRGNSVPGGSQGWSAPADSPRENSVPGGGQGWSAPADSPRENSG